MTPRERLKRRIVRERKIMIEGCEGRKFKEHDCSNGFHMHEAIFSRRHFQHLRPKAKEYFWDERNCAILCGFFHERYGHSREFREWWELYAEGYGDVEEFKFNAPLLIKN